jgi:nardilysin
LINLSDEDFNQIVTSLIKAKKTADVTLEEEVNRNWNEIISGEYLFDRHAKEISLLEACQKESMVSYMNGFLKKSDSRRKLSVQVKPKSQGKSQARGPHVDRLMHFCGPRTSQKFTKS